MSKEIAAAIRKDLKDTLGANSRQVSVRFKNWGSIYVTIKKAGFPLAKVTEVAERHERIRRCEVTGDILRGGNVCVMVSHCSARSHVVREHVYDWCKKNLRNDGDVASILPGVEVQRMEIAGDPYRYSLEVDGSEARLYSRGGVISAISVLMMDRYHAAESLAAIAAAGIKILDIKAEAVAS